MYENIEVIKDGRVATLALNRPEVLNAISSLLHLRSPQPSRSLMLMQASALSSSPAEASISAQAETLRR